MFMGEIMEFKQIVQRRYAARKFDGRKVPETTFSEIVDMTLAAPTSFNIQPYKMVVVRDSAMKEKLAVAAWNQPQITTCSHLIVFCANTQLMAHVDKLALTMPGATQYIEMMRGFVNGLDSEGAKVWAQKQTYIALGFALNGAMSLGIDSCPMEGFNSVEFAKILNLPAHIVPTVLCTIGYADAPKGTKFRFDKSEMVLDK